MQLVRSFEIESRRGFTRRSAAGGPFLAAAKSGAFDFAENSDVRKNRTLAQDAAPGTFTGKNPTFAESAKMGHPLQQQVRTRRAFAARARQGRYIINDRQGR
jgi:hypothetical protein